MRVCIVVGGRRLLQDPLLQAVEAVRAAGGQVTTITWFPVAPAIKEATDAQVELRAVDSRLRSTPAQTGIARVDRALSSLHARTRSPRGKIQRQWERMRRKAKFDGQAALVHRLVSRDPQCRALVAEADVLVAGDAASIRDVWFVVRRRPEIEALSGLGALRTYLSGDVSTVSGSPS